MPVSEMRLALVVLAYQPEQLVNGAVTFRVYQPLRIIIAKGK